MSKKWERFEELVRDIQARLSPDASVARNEKIVGRKSGTTRQIDVAIRKAVGQFQIFIAIECKDYSRPLDLKDVEETIGLIDDVGANKGAIISAKGFTAAALTRGREAGLNLYSVIDTSQSEWVSEATIPVIVNITKFSNCVAHMKAQNPTVQPPPDINSLDIFDVDGNRLGTATELFYKHWFTGEVPGENGRHTGIVFSPPDAFLGEEYGGCRVMTLADFDVSSINYYHSLPLAQVSGFRDEVAGQLITNEFTTSGIRIIDIEHDWRKLTSEDELAIKPVLRLFIRG